MTITKVQFIAYEINTFPRAVKGGKSIYVGKSDPPTDARDRVDLFQEAVETAYADSSWDRSKGTLKIFMAPEFYFRGTRGAYPLENYFVVLEGLKTVLEDSRYEGWLFVCGSVIARFLGDAESTGDSGNDMLIQNIVPVIKGGSKDEPRVVIKEHMSGIDFIEDGGTVRRNDFEMSDVQHPLAGRPGFFGHSTNTGAGKEAQGELKYSGLGIFDEYGLTFGLEVCLDHALKRLRKSPPGKNQAFVQIQLIPSAGMDIRDDATVAVRGGLVLNCDGNKKSECKIVEQACGRLGQDAVTAEIGVAKTLKTHSTARASALFDDTDAEITIYARTSIDTIVGVQKPVNTNLIFNPY